VCVSGIVGVCVGRVSVWFLKCVGEFVVCVYLCVRVCLCVRGYACLRLSVRVGVCEFLSACVCLCMCECVCVCVSRNVFGLMGGAAKTHLRPPSSPPELLSHVPGGGVALREGLHSHTAHRRGRAPRIRRRCGCQFNRCVSVLDSINQSNINHIN